MCSACSFDDPPTLDPHLSGDTTSAFLVVEIFSGLVTYSTDLQLVPDLAESWTISKDGLVYTFNLRPDAKFHDGKPVTAHHFKWSIERAANPDTASPVAETYLNDIVGAQEVLDGNATEMSGIEVLGDHTLQITIDAPKAYFLAKLTYSTAFVLDRENVESGGRNWADNPNGTGPFKLKEYRIGERIVLERNELYYREPAFVETVFMNLAGGQSMAMYENDEIDVTGISLFDIDRILDPSEPLNKELVIAAPGFSVGYIGFNTNVPPFDDVRFGSGRTNPLTLEVIMEMWEQVLGLVVNVDVRVQQSEWATYLDDLNRRKFQAFMHGGWSADYPDPQDFLDILFHSESENNNGGYSNPEVDSVLEEARVEQDVTERVRLYHQAEVMIVNDAAWVPTWYQGERYVLIKPRVKGYKLIPMIVPRLRHIYLEG